jgi:hypothetical protein
VYWEDRVGSLCRFHSCLFWRILYLSKSDVRDAASLVGES